jgi:hypothetical protein
MIKYVELPRETTQSKPGPLPSMVIQSASLRGAIWVTYRSHFDELISTAMMKSEELRHSRCGKDADVWVLRKQKIQKSFGE